MCIFNTLLLENFPRVVFLVLLLQNCVFFISISYTYLYAAFLFQIFRKAALTKSPQMGSGLVI